MPFKWLITYQSLFSTWFRHKYIWDVSFYSFKHFCWKNSWAVEVCVWECVRHTGGAQWGVWLMMVIRTVRSGSSQYNLNGKETTGLGCPCSTMLEFCHLACFWGPKLQFSVFFCSAWLWKIVSDECYRSHIQNGSFVPFYATFLYNQMRTWHVLSIFIFLLYYSSFADTIHFPLFIPLMFLLLISSNSPPSHCFFILSPPPPPQLSSAPPASYSFVWSPASYPQHIRCPANESGESEWRERVGRARCRTRRTGFNEAALNEFTACHWTAPSRVAGLAPRPLCQKAPSLCSPTCLSDTSCN